MLLDPHNYARYHGHLIGSAAVPNAAFADFWSRLATQFKGNDKVAFGLMNEPNNMPTEQWLSAANAALAAIRDGGREQPRHRAGQRLDRRAQLVAELVRHAERDGDEGHRRSGQQHAFEVHQYLDADSSGTSADLRQRDDRPRAAERLHHLAAHQRLPRPARRIAAARTPPATRRWPSMLGHLESNTDVWAGWTWWAAGPWWGGYMYSIEPAGATDKPQMATLAPYLD